MNINELDALQLSDYIKFNSELNPVLWTSDQKLRPEVRRALLAIADDFKEFLGVKDIGLKDITVSGSNAAYNYTDSSDIDLHLVVDLPEADSSEIFRELFDAKKNQYNDQHDITIGGYDVELYVQNANKPHYSQGIYSLLNDKWQIVPKKIKTEIDDDSVISKYQDLEQRILKAIDSNDLDKITTLLQKIKTMRQTGLEKHGEFGVENLTFKLLRSSGLIKQLIDAKNRLHDQQLSLIERKKKSKKKKFTYGYAGYWFPGFNFGDTGSGEGGGESLSESQDRNIENFADKIIKMLGITHRPKLILHNDPDWTVSTGSFGQYDPDKNHLHLATNDRHILDIIRTLAHELVHCQQRHRGRFPDDAGRTGSPYEDEANAMAGRIMRHLADQHPGLFDNVSLEESATGYIPRNKKEAQDPRYSMAITQDIQPGQVGKEANKLALNTGPNGEPGLLMKTKNLREGAITKIDSLGNQQPTGPETPPTMPAGTVRVDVSDVYDWYKLGQHISNMKGLGRHDFGKGPPSAIISFGDEDTEHKYIKDLEKTGLTTTDIDPKDPNQPSNIPRQKTDPTYNVDEDLAKEDLVKKLQGKLDKFKDQSMDKDPIQENYHWLKPGQLRGSYTDQELKKLGFKQNSKGAWYIEQSKWAELVNNKLINEKWSTKYKRSINCNNPRGFSQRAHCQGRKK
jgi:hypothetical protein